MSSLKYSKSVLGLYGRPPIVMSHGKGALLYDITGKEYLDFNAGIAVNALGHGDEKVAQVLGEQAKKLIHISNLYHNEYAGPLASALVSHMPPKGEWKEQGVFFCNSGTEANEAAIKFARNYAKYTYKNPEKYEIVSFSNAFHGRTMGSLSATHTQKYQAPFLPLVPGFKKAIYNDIDSVQRTITGNTCAVIMEPIQGEGGVHAGSPEFLEAVRKQCDKVGALLILDEIQCGLSRTGSVFAYQQTGIVPDILSLAKPIANGFPLGATIVGERVGKALKAGDHGTTFGGSPLATCLGLHVFKRLAEPLFLAHVKNMGQVLANRAAGLKAQSKLVVAHRGKGLIQGIQLDEKVELKKVVDLCLERQLLLVSAGCQTIRLIPPLIIQEQEIHRGMDVLQEVLKTLE